MKFNLLALLPLMWCVNAAPQSNSLQTENLENVITSKQISNEKDLKTAASSYSRQYSDWGGNSPGGYGYSITGFGEIDNKHNSNYGGSGGYDNSYKNVGYPGYAGNTGSFGSTGYVGNTEPFGSTGYVGNTGYVGSTGQVGSTGYHGGTGYNGYESYGGYKSSGFEGNGGYGGYGGNGGFSSYNGYNNPYYQESNHLGYGYYNKRPGFSNIYRGITPSLVTGYRGYTRR